MDSFYKGKGVRIKKYECKEINGEEVLIKTNSWKKFQEKELNRIKFKKTSLPYHVLDLSLEDIIEEKKYVENLKKYVNNFEEKYKSVHLYFWSENNGTQKTTTAGIVGKELLFKGFNVEFILMSKLSKVLTQESFEDGQEEVVKNLVECDFLIIDDSFDPKKITIYKSGYQIPFLDTFLRMRLEQKRKATCFTSNFSPKEIDIEKFGLSMNKLINRQIIDPFHFTTPFSKRNDFNVNNLWS